MIFLMILSFLIPILIGFFLISILMPREESIAHFWMRVCLGIGIGFGIVSCIFFVWLALFDPANKGFIFVEIIVFVCLAVMYFGIRKKRTNFKSLTRLMEIKNRDRVLAVVFLLCLLVGIIIFILLTLSNPHGSWDAWAIWNMRARFIFRGGGLWKDTFSPLIGWSHPDYPLFLPGAIARSWDWVGIETPAVPAIIAGIFSLATVGLVMTGITLLRSKTTGLLAGIVLLGTPLFIRQGASQYADVPLSFFILATFVLFFLQERRVKRNLLLVLAGIMAGFCCWIKNEGLLFLISINISFWLILSLTKGPRIYLKRLWPFILGILPILIILSYFKTRIAPSISEVLLQDSQLIWIKILDFSRYFKVLKAFGRQIFEFGGGFLGIVPLLALYSLLVGIKIDKKDRNMIAVSLVTLSLILVGLFGVYITTPYDLTWHLSTSLERLLLQLWPSFLFVYFMMISP